MRWTLIGGALLAACSSERPEYGDYARGATVFRVGIMQGVDNVIYRQGQDVRRKVPVLAGRDGLLRFYVNVIDEFEARDLTGVLELRDLEGTVVETLTETAFIDGISQTESLPSSINFRLSGDQITQGTEFRFELREADRRRRGGLEEDAVFDSRIDITSLNARPTSPLTLVIVPIRYQADGSGRVPDLTPRRVNEIRDAMYALYPTSDVTVRVEDPLDWFEQISPGGAGWGSILGTIGNRAATSGDPVNTYYYGVFDPAPSIQQFCRRGCILGLATLATLAEDFPRGSVGLGFPETVVGTLVHEVGHSHGLRHAPCGSASNVDREYPYEDAELGVWGYSLVSDELRPPERHDMMSYCDPIWISDYNFGLLHDRILELREFERSQPFEVTRLYVDGSGTVLTSGTVRIRQPALGTERVEVDVFDATGELVRTVEAAFDPFDHIDGGVVVLDEVLEDGLTARVRR